MVHTNFVICKYFLHVVRKPSGPENRLRSTDHPGPDRADPKSRAPRVAFKRATRRHERRAKLALAARARGEERDVPAPLQRKMDTLVQAGWPSAGAAGEAAGAAGEAAAPPEEAAGEMEEQRSAGEQQEQQIEEEEQIDEVDDDSQPADAGCEAQQVDVDVVDVGEEEDEAFGAFGGGCCGLPLSDSTPYSR